MAKKDSGTGFMVMATQTGFLGSLRFVNDKFICPDEEAFAPNWMHRLEPKEVALAANEPNADVGLGFTIKHVPAGNWTVLDKDGERVSRVFKKDEGNAKELAQAEAIRLNAGGDPVLPGPSGGGAKPDAESETQEEDQEDPNLPDA